MSFVDRTYADIVRDVLTNLTQGVTGEVHRVTYEKGFPREVILERRPVKRVSLVQGQLEKDGPAYLFTLTDYELVPNPQDPTDLNTIRFLPFGKKPAEDTDLRINYYPRTTDPTPLTDLNVGSVVRTLTEAVSRELAVLYAQLNLAYDSGFVETATGASLERVVALLGYNRFRAGRPVGSVRFSRRAGSTGNITIPAGTPVTDAEGKIRYETVETRDLVAGESTAEIRVRGATDATPVVDVGKLRVIQRAIAGIDTVTNERPTTRASDEESDEELRARTRAALLAANKGTVEAMQHGLLQMAEVRDVKITEMPNGVPGEVQVAISLAQPPQGGALPLAVEARIKELRPAGIRVIAALAGSVTLAVEVALVLAGSFFPPAEVENIRTGVKRALTDAVARAGVGQKIRVKPLVATLLADERLVDATLTLSDKGKPSASPGADFSPPASTFVQLLPDNITFAAETYDEPAAATGQQVPVEVHGSFRLTLVTGISVDTARGQLQNRLATFFSALTPGAEVNMSSVLIALRDDGKYSIDPLSARVTLASENQFVQIAQGGAAFTVLPAQVFSVAAVEVTV